MATVHVNGIDIYYRQEGDGPDLVMIMGLGAHSGAWLLNAPALAKHFRVTTFDNRGTGRSGAPDEPYSIAGMAGDTAALMLPSSGTIASPRRSPTAGTSKASSRIITEFL